MAVMIGVMISPIAAGDRPERATGGGRGSAARAQIDWPALQVGMELTVSGKLGIHGSDPHSYLALAVEDETADSGARLLRVQGDLRGELFELQGTYVTLHGLVTQLEIGPGFPMAIDVRRFWTGEGS